MSSLRRGDRGGAVAEIRAALAALGMLGDSDDDLTTGKHFAADMFDDDLDHAVRAFQQHRGLLVDGIVGERIRREAGWQVVTHHTTVADPRVRAPQAFTGRAHLLRVGRATSSARRLLCDDRRNKGLDTMVR